MDKNALDKVYATAVQLVHDYGNTGAQFPVIKEGVTKYFPKDSAQFDLCLTLMREIARDSKVRLGGRGRTPVFGSINTWLKSSGKKIVSLSSPTQVGPDQYSFVATVKERTK